MVDREDYLIPTVRYPVDDATKIQKFIFVVDFGDDCDELGQRELDTTGKDSVEGGRLRIEWTVMSLYIRTNHSSIRYFSIEFLSWYEVS